MLLNFTSKHNRFCKSALNPILFLLVLPFSLNFVIYYYRNQSAENLFGYPASEALGQDALMLLVDSRDHNVVHDIFRRISMGESWTGKFPVKNRGGDRFSAIATNSMMRMAVWWVSFVFQVIPANWSRYFVGLQLLQGHNQNRLGHLVMVVAATAVA